MKTPQPVLPHWPYGLDYIFSRNKTFFKIESWNVQHLFCETLKNFSYFNLYRQLLFRFFSMGCLFELKFCEVSRNPKSNRCWKFETISVLFSFQAESCLSQVVKRSVNHICIYQEVGLGVSKFWLKGRGHLKPRPSKFLRNTGVQWYVD